MNNKKLLLMIELDEVRTVGESKQMKYYADRLGNIYSMAKGNHRVKKLKLSKNAYGYPIVFINNKNKYIHRLVYEAFKGKIPNGYQINHIDGVKDNNTCTEDASNNLEAVTPAENLQHARENGLNQCIRLTHEERMLIADTFDKDIEQSVLSISRDLNIPYETVYNFIQSYKKSQYKRLIEDDLNKGKAIIEMNRNQLQITNTLSTSERIKLDIETKTNKKESK